MITSAQPGANSAINLHTTYHKGDERGDKVAKKREEKQYKNNRKVRGGFFAEVRVTISYKLLNGTNFERGKLRAYRECLGVRLHGTGPTFSAQDRLLKSCAQLQDARRADFKLYVQYPHGGHHTPASNSIFGGQI